MNQSTANQPTQIGEYEILALIREDGYGLLYRARHSGSKADVLLRAVNPELAGRADYRERFLAKAKTAMRVEHPHLARALGAGEADGVLYSAWEFSGGDSLAEGAKRRARSESTALQIGLCVAEALKLAWEKEWLVHGGLSPHNIYIDANGILKVFELGLARPTGGEIYGDPRFMALEQLTGEQSIDARADIYSLALVLYLVMTAQKPFRAATAQESYDMHLKQQLADPRATNPAISVSTCRILEKMLARNVADRYRSWDELIRDINCVLGNLPLQTEPLSAGKSILQLATPPAQAPKPPVAPPPSVVKPKDTSPPAAPEKKPDTEHKPVTSPKVEEPSPPPKPASPRPAQSRKTLQLVTVLLLILLAVAIVVGTAIALVARLGSSSAPTSPKGTPETTAPTRQQPDTPPQPEPQKGPEPPPQPPPEPQPTPPPAAAPKDPAAELAKIELFGSANPTEHTQLADRLKQFIEEFPDSPETAKAKKMLEKVEAKVAQARAEEQARREQEEAREREERARKEQEAQQQAEIQKQQEEARAKAQEAFEQFLSQFHDTLRKRQYGEALKRVRQLAGNPGFETFQPQLAACEDAARRLEKFWDSLPAALARAKGRRVTTQGISGLIDNVTGHDVTLEVGDGSVVISLTSAAADDVLALAALVSPSDDAQVALDKAWFCFAEGKYAEVGHLLDAARKNGVETAAMRDAMGMLSAEFREADAARSVAQLREAVAAQNWSAARASLDLLKSRYAQTRTAQAAQKELVPLEGVLTYHEDIVRLPAASVLRTFPHPAPVTAVAFHPRGRYIAAASQNLVRLWDMVTGQVTREIDTGFAEGIRLLMIPTHGRVLVAACADPKKGAKIFEVASGRTLASCAANASSIAASPDGRFIAAIEGGYLKLWHLETGEPVKEFGGGPWGVHMAQFTPDGQLVSVWRINEQVVRWHDLPSGKVTAELKALKVPIVAMTLTVDGKTLVAVTNDGTFRICARDVTGEPRSFGEGVNPHAGIALSSDGRYMAAATDISRIKLWNVATGKAVRLFQGHTAPVRGVACSPDLRFIASGSDDCTLRIWKLWDGDSGPPVAKGPTAK